MPEFFREPTTEEKRDFRPIPIINQKKSAKDLFREQLQKKETDFLHIRKKPFCSRCARLDFQDEIERSMKEYERSVGFVEFEKLKIKIPDLDQYGNFDRFKLIGESKAVEPTKPDFTRGMIQRSETIGIHKDYKCKIRGCGISIFISNTELENENQDGNRDDTNKRSDPIREKPKKKY